MKAKKIEKLENGDYHVTLQCYDDNVVNKYFVPMPSAVAEYFFDFMKRGLTVIKRKTITKNGNKCVFELSFDTADAATMTITADTEEAQKAYQAGEYQEEEAEFCNNAAEEAEKHKNDMEKAAEEKAAAEKVEKAEKVKMPRCLCGEMIIQEDAQTLREIQENKGVPTIIKNTFKINKGKVLNVEKDEARVLCALISIIQKTYKERYFEYASRLAAAATSKEEFCNMIIYCKDESQRKENRAKMMPPDYILRVTDIAREMYHVNLATNNQVTEVSKLINSLSNKQQIAKSGDRYFTCRLIDIDAAAVEKKKNGTSEMIAIKLGWLTYWNVARNFSDLTDYYLQLTSEREYNTKETQYICAAAAANSGREKFSLEKNKIAQFANGGHNKKRSDINTLKTLDRMKADKQINNYTEKNKVAAKKADIIEIENNCNCNKNKK
jgi:hypothetical protein